MDYSFVSDGKAPSQTRARRSRDLRFDGAVYPKVDNLVASGVQSVDEFMDAM